jgi:hypothetical protein
MWAGNKRLGTILVVGLLAGSSTGVAAQDETSGTADPVWVTGSVQPASSCSGPDTEMDGDVNRYRNVECSPQAWTSSDPRLTSEVVRRWNQDVHHTGEGSVEVGTDAAYLRNDGGSWACSNNYVEPGFSGAGSHAQTFTCVGDGGYAGLSAILVLEDVGRSAEEFIGLVFFGDFPPLPEPPSME